MKVIDKELEELTLACPSESHKIATMVTCRVGWIETLAAYNVTPGFKIEQVLQVCFQTIYVI